MHKNNTQPETTPNAQSVTGTNGPLKRQPNANKIRQLKAEAAKTPIDYEKKARIRRKKRALRLVLKLSLFVIVPTVSATIYYVWFAKDQFMSTSGVTVQSGGNSSVGIDSVLGTFATDGSSRDATTVQQYILSRDMLRLLDEKTGFIEHFKSSRIDYLARLAPDASFEDAFTYYLEMVSAVYDMESGVLTIEVKAFDAKNANLFARTIIQLAEDKVNKMSQKMQKDKIRFTQEVVKEAETRLANAQKNVLQLQQDREDFNPDQSARAGLALKTQLEGALVHARSEFSQARAIMSPNAPQVQALSRKLQAIQGQIKNLNKRLLGSDSEGGGLGRSMADFEMATLEKQLAQKEYESALISLETARLDTLKQRSYLIEISSPSLPDEATYPIRWLKILTVLLVSLASFGVLSLLISAVKEHARV